MADVFGRTTLLGGAMSADATRLTFSQSALNAGLIVQNLVIQYAQTITRLFALESGLIYFVAGRTDGNMELQHVVGPQGIASGFIRQYGDVCNVQGALAFSAAGGCGAQEFDASIVVSNPVINSLNLQVNSNDMIIGSGMRMMFTSMDFGD